MTQLLDKQGEKLRCRECREFDYHSKWCRFVPIGAAPFCEPFSVLDSERAPTEAPLQQCPNCQFSTTDAEWLADHISREHTPPRAERHEYAGYANTSDRCLVSGCGLPRSAPVHAQAEPRKMIRLDQLHDSSLDPKYSDQGQQPEPRTCVKCGHCDMDADGMCRHLCYAGFENRYEFACGCKCEFAPVPPVKGEVKRSELGEFWATWFEAVGEHATIDVVHATTKLVLAEREIAVRDSKGRA